MRKEMKNTTLHKIANIDEHPWYMGLSESYIIREVPNN